MSCEVISILQTFDFDSMPGAFAVTANICTDVAFDGSFLFYQVYLKNMLYKNSYGHYV